MGYESSLTNFIVHSNETAEHSAHEGALPRTRCVTLGKSRHLFKSHFPVFQGEIIRNCIYQIAFRVVVGI